MAAGLVAATAHAQSNTWKVPRTPDGHPDLQGVWSNNSVTPMTRPAQWKDKERLTDAEVEELKRLVAQYTDQGGDAIFGSLVQMALNANGAQVDVDGKLGAKTVAALKTYQKPHNLHVTGKADPATVKALGG